MPFAQESLLGVKGRLMPGAGHAGVEDGAGIDRNPDPAMSSGCPLMSFIVSSLHPASCRIRRDRPAFRHMPSPSAIRDLLHVPVLLKRESTKCCVRCLIVKQLSAKQGVSGPCGTREPIATATNGSWPSRPGAGGDVVSGDAAIQETEHRDQPKGTSFLVKDECGGNPALLQYRQGLTRNHLWRERNGVHRHDDVGPAHRGALPASLFRPSFPGSASRRRP